MKRTPTDQHGFELVTVAVVAVLVALMAFAGYRVVSNRQAAKSTTGSTSQVTIPNKISSKSDLRQASKALDAEQVDKQLDTTQLDKNITDLL